MSGRPESSQTPTSTEVSRPVESELEQIRGEVTEKYALVYQIEALRERSNSLISHVDDAESGETDEEQVVVAEAWRQLREDRDAVDAQLRTNKEDELPPELKQRLGKLVAGVDRLAEVGSRTDGWLIGQVKAGKDWPEIADLAVRVGQVDQVWGEVMEDEDLQREIAAVRGDDESVRDRKRILQAMAIARGAGVEDIGRIAELSREILLIKNFIGALRNAETTRVMTLIDTFQPEMSDDDKQVAAGKMRNLLGITQNLGGGTGTPTEPESEDPPERPRVSENECKAQLEAQFGELWDREAMREVADLLKGASSPDDLVNRLKDNPRLLRAAVMLESLRIPGKDSNYYRQWLTVNNKDSQVPRDLSFVDTMVLEGLDLDLSELVPTFSAYRNMLLGQAVRVAIEQPITNSLRTHQLSSGLHDVNIAQLLILGKMKVTQSPMNVGSRQLDLYLSNMQLVLGVNIDYEIQNGTPYRHIVVTSPVEVVPDPVVVAPTTPDTGGSSSGPEPEPDPATAISRVDTADADREARLREGLVEAFGDANVDRLMRKLAEYAGLSEDERKAFWDELKGEDLKDFLRLDGWVLMSSYDAVPDDETLRVAIGKLHDEVAEADSYQTFQIGVRQLINRGEVRAHVSDLAALQKFVNERELGWELEVVGDMIRVKEGEPVEKKMEVWGLDEKSKAQKCLEQAWKAGSSMVARHAEVLADAEDEVTDEQVRRGAELAEKLAKIYDRSERREQRVTGYGEAAGYVEGKFVKEVGRTCRDGFWTGNNAAVVVDGVGSRDGTDIAKEEAIRALQALDTVSVDQDIDLLIKGILRKIREANEKVKQLASDYPATPPGVVMSGAMIKPADGEGNREALIFWSGDCRGGVLREDGTFEGMTLDHTSSSYLTPGADDETRKIVELERQKSVAAVQTEDDIGKLDPAAKFVWNHPDRIDLNAYLGMDDPEIGVIKVSLKPGESILLYSDGVARVMAEPELQRILKGKQPLSERVENVRSVVRRRMAEYCVWRDIQKKEESDRGKRAAAYLGRPYDTVRTDLAARIDLRSQRTNDDAVLVAMQVGASSS